MMNLDRDDTDLFRGYIERGEPIPAGSYVFPFSGPRNVHLKASDVLQSIFPLTGDGDGRSARRDD